MRKTIQCARWSFAVAISFVAGCAGQAGTASGGGTAAERLAPHWNGRIDSVQHVGVYLATEPGIYSQAGFEAMAQGEEVMKALRGGRPWAWIDSSHPGVSKLGGWDLDSLAILIASDSALYNLAGAKANARGMELGAGTRAALLRVGAAYGQEMLIVLRPGGARADKDSTKLFQDHAWFGVFDLAAGTLLYRLQAKSEGKQSSESSAESDWARSTWVEFRKAMETLPQRIKP